MDNGKFAFNSPANGEYVFCFKNLDNKEKVIKFDVHSGVKAKDYSSVAQKDHLKPLETQLRLLEDLSYETINKYRKIRDMEDKIYNDNGKLKHKNKN